MSMTIATNVESVPEKGWDLPKLIAWMRAEKSLCERHRDPYLRLFLQALRFWAGDQWRDVIESALQRFDTRQVRPVATEDFRLTDNQLPIYCRQLVAVATQNLPRLQAVPENSTDPQDVFAAQLGSAFLDQRNRIDKEYMLREAEWLWLMGVGECLRFTIYDPEGGDPLFAEGDLSTQEVDPFSYLKDPYSKTWPPRFLFLSEARHVDWVKEYYGVTVEPETVADATLFYDALSMNVVWGGAHQQRETMRSAAVVDQLWIPPGKRYPEGWCFVRVGDHLVASHPLQAGQWPFAKAGWYPIPGRLYPQGLIELVMGDQRQLNALVTLLHEAASKQVRGDMAVTGPVAPDARSIRQVVYNPKTGAKITVLGPGVEAVPMRYTIDWQQAEMRRQQLDRNLHQKTGVNVPSLGQTMEKEVRVGELMISREGDIQVNTWHLMRYTNLHLTEIARQKLELARVYYILPRQLDGIGTRREVTWFQGADLRNTRDVIVVATPHMTPAMKQQARMEAFGARLRGPYENLAHQYAARSTLRDTGLDDVDQQLSVVYGPFEELEAKVKAVVELQQQAEIIAAQMAVQLAAAGPQLPEGA